MAVDATFGSSLAYTSFGQVVARRTLYWSSEIKASRVSRNVPDASTWVVPGTVRAAAIIVAMGAESSPPLQ